MIKAVLFDLDGVIVDTEGIYTHFWGSMDELYPTGIPNFAHVIKGSTLTKILSTYFPDPKIQEEVKQHLLEQEDNMKYELFPGVLELLRGLREKGVKTAIVTSSNDHKMRHLFDVIPELGELIDTLVTDEDVTRSKPDPQGYLIAAERLGAGKGEFVVVEDSLAGLEAGRRSGGKVLGICTTNPRAKVEPLSDVTLDSISQATPEMLMNM